MAEPQKETQDWKRDLTKLRDDVRTMADDLRVRIHLAGMDAKDAWNKLEPRLQEFEQRAENAVQTTSTELREAAKDLKARLQKLRESL